MGVCAGNDSGGECGVATARRFIMPGAPLSESVSTGADGSVEGRGSRENPPFWYSFDYGSVHFVMLSTEHDVTPGSHQYRVSCSYMSEHVQKNLCAYGIAMVLIWSDPCFATFEVINVYFDDALLFCARARLVICSKACWHDGCQNVPNHMLNATVNETGCQDTSCAL